MPRAHQAFIGVGANLGDRAAALKGASEKLKQTAGIASVEGSRVFETEPVGLVDQPRFLNQVLGLETKLSPEQLLVVLQRIEGEFGRVRTVRWGPRTLDLDLLAYDQETRQTPELTLPHPRMLERAFVTVPLRELLARPRFRRPAWDPLRVQLGSTAAAAPGIQPYRA